MSWFPAPANRNSYATIAFGTGKGRGEDNGPGQKDT